MESMSYNNASKAEYVQYIKYELQELGLAAATQAYEIKTTLATRRGVNVYASFSAPRASSFETMVLCASWLSLSMQPGSLGSHNINMRGVASIMALAGHIQKSSFWARDVVFVISDGFLDGMLAFLDSYHASRTPGITSDPLDLVSGGVIWTALCVDYPGHSFSDVGLYYEGTNARLPNQDLLNSVGVISTYTGGSSVLIYDHEIPRTETLAGTISTFPGRTLQAVAAGSYFAIARTIIRHLSFSALGRPSGLHGLFHQFRIDAVTIFAKPADGPHGFYALGKIVESSVRTMNNLLERLHASFFFYLLTGPTTFIPIGKYLPSVVLIGIGMELNGLHRWVSSGWKHHPEHGAVNRWTRQQRPVAVTCSIIAGTHIFGLLLFLAMTYIPSQIWASFPKLLLVSMSAAMNLPSIIGILHGPPSHAADKASISSVLHALTLCIAGTISCIISVLNFSFAACLVVLLGIPLSMIPRMTINSAGRILGTIFFMMLMPVPILLSTGFVCEAQTIKTVLRLIWDWQVLESWFLPSVFCIYYPLVVQGCLAIILNH
ncbi:GPI transamidase component Gaa1 [Cantharellus anzutake]|uniref:GPI transamidase component Gaa1 n=1 Tax=Cantharellus anzutake TaxID=1750568 RepID=UPI0019078B8A|nr:GPI transamidase component Gaa1 [Cantharellus anzutake]KAF8343901.1 GPI transamidase component Gaa1 [Cantharellus anzutake]